MGHAVCDDLFDVIIILRWYAINWVIAELIELEITVGDLG